MNTLAFKEALQLSHGPVTAVDLALFAASSGDHNPLHLDADVASAAGFAKPVVHGMLSMAFVARLFTSHYGARCLRSLSTRFVGVALRGDTLNLTAKLVSEENGVALYDVSATTAADQLIISGKARVSWAP